MNRLEAVLDIVRESRRERGTVSGYKRLLRALRVLEFSDEDQENALCYLDYHSPNGGPYEWLAQKLKDGKK